MTPCESNFFVLIWVVFIPTPSKKSNQSLSRKVPLSLYSFVLSCFSCFWLFATSWTVAPRLLCPWDFPGKNTEVGCHFPLKRIFLTQGLNPHLLVLLHLQEGSLSLVPPGNSLYILPALKSLTNRRNVGWFPCFSNLWMNSLLLFLCRWSFYFPGGSDCKSVCLQCGRTGFDPWVRKIPQRRQWQPTSVLLPGKSHGWRSLVGCSLWGRKELDTTEWLHFY